MVFIYTNWIVFDIAFLNHKLWNVSAYLKIYLALWLLASIVSYAKCFYPRLLGVIPSCEFDMLLYFHGYLGYLFDGLF